MPWKPLVAIALLTLSAPVFADEKGEALVRGWLAQRADIFPIAAEWTISYRIGKLRAIYKHEIMLAHDEITGSRRPYQFDNDFPFDLFNDPLGDILDPLPQGGNLDQAGISSKWNYGNPTYLGKETVEGVEYDIVEVHEFLNIHFTPPPRMLLSLKRTPDNRIAVKWYLDVDGVPRRMTFASDVEVYDGYVTFRSAFDPPSKKTPDPQTKVPAILPPARPASLKTFTATMVLDSIHKPRNPPVRESLGEPLFTVPQTNSAYCVFSPDSNLLATRTGSGVQVVQADTGQRIFAPGDSVGQGRVDFSQDGKSLAFASVDAKSLAFGGADGITVVRTEDGHKVGSIVHKFSTLQSFRLSPDGKRVATTSQRPIVEIWDVATGALTRTIKGEGPAYEAIFTADGKELVVASMNNDILVWDTDSWQIKRRLPIHNFAMAPLAVSHTGNRIAIVDADNHVLMWDGAGDQPVQKLKGAVGRIMALMFAADDKTIYAVDAAGGYVRWDLAAGTVTANRLSWRKKEEFWLGVGAVSPDGKYAAFPGSPSAGGAVAVFDLGR